MKNYRITVNGNTYDVQVEELGASQAPVAPAAPQASAPAATPAPATPAPAPQASAPAATGEGEKVTAPMPGNIFLIYNYSLIIVNLHFNYFTANLTYSSFKSSNTSFSCIAFNHILNSIFSKLKLSFSKSISLKLFRHKIINCNMIFFFSSVT